MLFNTFGENYYIDLDKIEKEIERKKKYLLDNKEKEKKRQYLYYLNNKEKDDNLNFIKEEIKLLMYNKTKELKLIS